MALTVSETTHDYVWALQQYRAVVTLPPKTILTDADPGSTAAVASVLPGARHLWCLWHLHQNLRKNLGSKLGVQFADFCADFKAVQRQVSEPVFWKQYNELKAKWPDTVPYLDDQLTRNAKFWAGYSFDTFTTGAVSTQRGEGLNRHMKKHLSLSSPLVKVFDEVLNREQREKARSIVQDAVEEVRHCARVDRQDALFVGTIGHESPH